MCLLIASLRALSPTTTATLAAAQWGQHENQNHRRLVALLLLLSIISNVVLIFKAKAKGDDETTFTTPPPSSCSLIAITYLVGGAFIGAGCDDGQPFYCVIIQKILFDRFIFVAVRAAAAATTTTAERTDQGSSRNVFLNVI